MWKANNKHRVSVTVSNSESGETDRSSCGTTHTGARSRPRVGFGTPNTQRLSLAQIRLYTDSHGVFAWQSVTLHLTLPTQLISALRCDAVGFPRVHPEENIKYDVVVVSGTALIDISPS
jgi:hypothetical protein